MVQEQIDLLNQYFRGEHDDTSYWLIDSKDFPNTKLGRSILKFIVANSNHPEGYDFEEGNIAITVNEVIGDSDINWNGYLNIFVRPSNYLGLSPYGEEGNVDGVYVNYNACDVGTGCGSIVPEAPYNEGKTVVHEIGHYFFLKHIWGNMNGCQNDDSIADTPLIEVESLNCPNSKESCGSPDMYFNFMDYTDDLCMYMLCLLRDKYKGWSNMSCIISPI